MKKSMALLAALTLVLAFSAVPAEASDTRQSQSSAIDKSTPPNTSPFFDVTELQLALTNTDDFEVFLSLKSTPSASSYQTNGSLAKIEFDTNLDGKTDFSIDSIGKYDPDFQSPRTMMSGVGEALEECEATGWITGKALGWSIPKSCFGRLASTIGIRASATKDGTSTDYLPDGSSWFKPKTGYMASATCSSTSYANKKLTYNSITYLCMKTSGKWSWKNYGPIAAKSAKYLTEKAYYACPIQGKISVELADGGKTLSLETYKKYEISLYVSEANFECVKKYVGMPSWVSTMIGQTRALDGMVKASWGQINAFWNYHPDSGLNITFNHK